MPLSSDRHIIDNKFREALSNHKVSPSGRVWNRVTSDMNAQQQRRISVRNIAATSILLFIVGTGIWTAINEQPGKTISLSDVRQLPSSPIISSTENHSSADISNTTAASNKKESEDVLTASVNPVKEHSNNSSSSKGGVNSVNSPTFFESESNVAPEQGNGMISPGVFSANPGAADLTPLHLSLAAIPSGERDHDFSNYRLPNFGHDQSDKSWLPDLRGWYAGFSASLNSTWILDQTAITNANFKYRATFGKAYSFLTGYNFSNKLGVEAAWVFSSIEGQRYVYQLVTARSIDISNDQKLIAFNYMQLPVMVKLKSARWSNITQAPVIVNYGFGVQYGRLLSVNTSGNEDQTINNSVFRKNEYALVAGIDYDFMSKRSSFLTLGARASYGSNLFSKGAPSDIEFSYPHNFVIGIRAAINLTVAPRPPLPAK